VLTTFLATLASRLKTTVTLGSNVDLKDKILGMMVLVVAVVVLKETGESKTFSSRPDVIKVVTTAKISSTLKFLVNVLLLEQMLPLSTTLCMFNWLIFVLAPLLNTWSGTTTTATVLLLWSPMLLKVIALLESVTSCALNKLLFFPNPQTLKAPRFA
jgi:hypothetical protein